jgi:hypothetical protein
MMCKIDQNQESGFVSMTKKGLRCDAVIKYSSITKNKEFGLVITGHNNFSRIEKNIIISENTKAGIKVENDA